MGVRSFFDRFVHPYVAMVVVVGIAIWFLSFFVAAAGLYFQRLAGEYQLAVLLFYYSGVIGTIGIVVIAACILYLGAIWLLRDVLGVIGS
ncbi:hypothetical protein [Halocalculus aciditolerans]|uniref:Yip1 domain-containing protein n=1 Tax=Halocalculus aciditolerans TaxID=1383812 RepID=A0A830F1J9_9EURY|nr:hypothetical protein [Halocalculus aciditolerans]GGL52611.1 hypothetical protein GCM10009039_08580 [Halocalculus aciditolerans]